MSTPYNDQWLLGRSRWRRRGRAPVGAGFESGTDPLGQPPGNEREVQDKGQPQEKRTGAMRKRPRWIDRDT
jgi:hypothetical protein